MAWRVRLVRREPPTFRRVRRYDTLPDVPDVLQSGTVAIVGAPRHPKWVAFDCPCARRHRIVLPVAGPTSRWAVTTRWRRPTIQPSVDSDDGERCHHLVNRGRVRWVA